MRLGLHVEIAGDCEQAIKHLSDTQFTYRLATHWLADCAQCRREFID